MNEVLVDTSVWIDHFRKSNAALCALLAMDEVMIHPMVLGEIACGTPPTRARTLADLTRLRSAEQPNLREVMVFLEREQLFGLGCGFVDITLLVSVRMTPGAKLWTADKRLDTLAERLGLRYRP